LTGDSETTRATQSLATEGINGSAPPPPPAAEERPKKGGAMKLSYEDYKHMANLLVLHMRRAEEHAVAGKRKLLILICSLLKK